MNDQFKDEYDFFGNPLREDTDYHKLSNVYRLMDDKLLYQTRKDPEAQYIYKEHNRMKTMGLKDLLDLLGDDEREIISCLRIPFWYKLTISNNSNTNNDCRPKDVVIYLDIYSNVDNEVDNSKTKSGFINLDDDKLLKESSLTSLAVIMEHYGANLSHALTYDVSHIIINPDDTSRIQQIKDRLATLNISKYLPYALLSSWVNRCIEDNSLVIPSEDEKYYW